MDEICVAKIMKREKKDFRPNIWKKIFGKIVEMSGILLIHLL